MSSSAAPAESTSHQVHLDDTLGAAYIGLVFAAILFGVTNVQTLIYYQSSERDPKYLKVTITFLWLLDTFHLFLISHFCYIYLVTNFTNLLAITVPTWSLCLHVHITTLSDFIVRLFYARRVWIISRQNWFLTLATLLFTSVTFVSGLFYASKLFTYSSTKQFTELSPVLYTSLGSAVAADLWVASSLCYFLARNKSGFKETDSKVNTVILYIISTGVLTSFCSIACFVSFATMPHNYVYIGIYFILPKLYFNSMLATLNARERLRESKGGPDSGSGIVDTDVYQMPRFVVSSPRTSKTATSFGTVNVNATTEPTTRNAFNVTDRGGCGISLSVNLETEYRMDEREMPKAYAATLSSPLV